MGGLPRQGDEGLIRFKTRWSNRKEPVFLLRFVNDRAAYAELARGRERGSYFPVYRAPLPVPARSSEVRSRDATISAPGGRGADHSPGSRGRRGPLSTPQPAAHIAER